MREIVGGDRASKREREEERKKEVSVTDFNDFTKVLHVTGLVFSLSN